jgi:hypothetical protein
MKHIITVVLLILIFAPAPDNTPKPTPDPDVPPVVVVPDLWNKASEVQRILTSDALDEFAAKEFKNDDEKLKFILEHTEAARKAAFNDVNTRLQTAVKDNKVKDFATSLRSKELK